MVQGVLLCVRSLRCLPKTRAALLTASLVLLFLPCKAAEGEPSFLVAKVTHHPGSKYVVAPYEADASSGEVSVAVRGVEGESPRTLRLGRLTCQRVVVDGRHLYYSGGESVVRLDLASGEKRVVASAPLDFWDIYPWKRGYVSVGGDAETKAFGLYSIGDGLVELARELPRRGYPVYCRKEGASLVLLMDHGDGLCWAIRVDLRSKTVSETRPVRIGPVAFDLQRGTVSAAGSGEWGTFAEETPLFQCDYYEGWTYVASLAHAFLARREAVLHLSSDDIQLHKATVLLLPGHAGVLTEDGKVTLTDEEGVRQEYQFAR